MTSPLKGKKRGPRPPGWVNPLKGVLKGPARPIEERFWEKVNKTDTCWLWTAAKMPFGYGRFGVGVKNELAHVVSLRLAGVDIPAGMVVDHVCRNPSCVRPDHLRIVTRSFNATENNESPLARNRRKTHCPQGHPYTDDNIAVTYAISPSGSRTKSRTCLTCFPWYWKHAVIPRSKPPAGYCAGQRTQRRKP